MFVRRRASITPAIAFLSMVLGCAPAMAGLVEMPTNECDVSSSAPNSACNLVSSVVSNGAVVANDTNAPILGARSVANTNAATPIDAYGYCRYVNNASTNSIFVPFRTSNEWQAFINHHPSDVNLMDCSRGGSVSIPPNFGSSLQTNQCTVATPASQSYTAPYRIYPPAASITAPAVSFNCQSPTGTAFTEIAVAQYAGLDSGSNEPNNSGVVGWTLSNVTYSYNGMCGSANGVTILNAPNAGLCSVGAPSGVTLNNEAYGWTCSGGNGGGSPASCGAPLQVAQCGTAIVDISGNLTGGNFCSMGTASGVNTSNATYTCSYGSGATETSASCKAIMPGQCGSDAGQTLASTPVNLCSASDTASAVTQTDTGWTWSCALAGESDSVACSATAIPPAPPTPSCSSYVWNDVTSAGQLGWSNVNISGDGNHIVASAYTPHWADAYTYNEYNYVSSDGGGSWRQMSNVPATAMAHSSAVMSSDGSHILIDQPEYVTSNGGGNWSTYVSGGTSYQMASSADGNILVQATWYMSSYGALPVSRDGGHSWAHSGFADWGFLSTGMSDNGQVIAAVGNDNNVFVSTNAAQSAAKITTPGTKLSTVAVSGDGKIIYVAGSQHIYKSTDNGQSWATLSSAGTYQYLARSLFTSADGQRVVITYESGPQYYVILSVDGGATWCPQISGVMSAGMSRDGKKIIAMRPIGSGTTYLSMGVSP